jgi:hypothetical protein
MIERTGEEGKPRNTVVVGTSDKAESSRVGLVEGEVRMATRKSAELRFLADGSVSINGTMMGSDVGVYTAVRSLFDEPIISIDTSVRSRLCHGNPKSLFSNDDLTAAEREEVRKFWTNHAIEETIALGPMALPVESGDIVMRNRRGQSLRVRADGSCSSESMLLRPDQVMGHLRSLFSTTP